ncbi:MAG: hypothetical protein Q7V17_01385 [Afipia sp.]|nr:hypothetical protein [Afipia sp.]
MSGRARRRFSASFWSFRFSFSMCQRALDIAAPPTKTSRDVESICESDSQKVGKSSPVRAVIAPKPIFPENIFVAKICDSESAKRVFRQSQSYARFYWCYDACCIAMKEVAAAQAFL